MSAAQAQGGCERQPPWPDWAWRQVPVIGFQARNSAIA